MTRILILFLSAVTFASVAQKRNAGDLVRETFSGYKNSILASDGKEAINWVDGNTLAYYDRMLSTAVNADSAEVQQLKIMDKLTVLTLRHRIPKEEVLQMTGRDFFIYAINQGMVGKSSVKTIEIGKVEVNGNTASGQVVAGGREAPLFFKFHREDDSWKLDITSIFDVTTAGLMQMLSQNGMTENEFIFQALEMLTGEAPGEEVWQPLK